MADFVAVLRKTIGALGENTPEMREKVYDKARATIDAKLAALDPQPPAAVIERQRKALDDAIAVLRSDYAAPAEPEKDEGLEDVFASLKTPMPPPPVAPAAARPASSTPRDPVLDPEPPAHRVEADREEAPFRANDDKPFPADEDRVGAPDAADILESDRDAVGRP